MEPYEHAGWHPEYGRRSRALVEATVGYATIRSDAPSPDAWCIPALREMSQGQAGTCHEHAAVAAAEDTALALGYEAFPICRRMVGWVGQQFFSPPGNQASGGSPTFNLLGMTSGQGGYGIAHESLFPYTDAYYALAQKPPASAFTDAGPHRLDQPVAVRDDDDAMRLIASNHAIANGIWWTPTWDTRGATFFSAIGGGSFGHALEERGYAKPGVFDDHLWFNLRNWHGRLYRPLPASLAAKVPNYRPDSPDATTDFWVRADVLATVRGYSAGSERVAVTDMQGFGHLFNPADAPSPGGFYA